MLAYDDIANNPENPYPGQIFNKPTAVGTPGVDVYAGCKIDYSGASVTPATFEAVLKGNKAEEGALQTKLLEMNLMAAPQVADQSGSRRGRSHRSRASRPPPRRSISTRPPS